MKPLNKLLTTAIISLAIITPIHAQTTATEHNHGHDQHAESALTLDQGKKWQSDAPLRQGIQIINHAVVSNVYAFHHQALTKPDAEKLAQHIHEQVAYLVANCKLEPKADATLHVIVGEMLAGAEALAREPQSEQGMPVIVKALRLYPVYFEHKGWVGIEN